MHARPATFPQTSPPRPARWRALLLLTAVVLLAHALLLRTRNPLPGGHDSPPRLMQVRLIGIDAGAALVAAAPDAAPPNPNRERPAPAQASAATKPTRLARPSGLPEEAALPGPQAGLGQDALPIYATRPPPPATLRYTMRRAGQDGSAELRWQPSEGGYALSLQGELRGRPALGWVSQGGFDNAGVAPERYTERRRGRDIRAVNFQRQAGRISFSGPDHDLPLASGAQDRLSWLLQLSAILAAEPRLAAPGTELQLFVAGPFGEAEVWTFQVLGSETLELPAGPIEGAVRLLRDAQRPYDTRAEVWLDPARHHLPVRLRLQLRPGGEGTELLLHSTQWP